MVHNESANTRVPKKDLTFRDVIKPVLCTPCQQILQWTCFYINRDPQSLPIAVWFQTAITL